ncbi:MAG: hypothetical protein LUF68_08860, partial [Clostridiales bacterium]|nr:hypothetical protein [Clostridiales bacterium]
VEKEEWTPFSWHCPNCGALVTGYKGSDGAISVECSRCRIVMVRRLRSKQHDRIDLYASKLMGGDYIKNN